MTKPTTTTVKVTDIQITRRAVEVPVECPTCGADLSQPRAVQEYQLTDERWRSRLALGVGPSSCMEGDEGNGTIVDYHEHDCGPGDNQFIGPVHLLCMCGATIAECKITEVDHG